MIECVSTLYVGVFWKPVDLSVLAACVFNCVSSLLF